MRYVETRVVLVKLGDGWARKLGEVVEAMNGRLPKIGRPQIHKFVFFVYPGVLLG